MPAVDLVRLGQVLRHAREERGMTQDSLAEATDLSKKYISNIERGKSNPSYDVLYRLVSALNISADIFFNVCDIGPEADEQKFLLCYRRCPIHDRQLLQTMTTYFVDELLKR